MKTILLVGIMQLLLIGASAQQSAPIFKRNSNGLAIYDSVANLNSMSPYKQEYEDLQRRRTRNRTLLDLALTYAPTGFGTGLILDPMHPKKKNYILHADLIPQFVIGGEWMKFPIFLTARYKVRILGEDAAVGDTSLPVRTPSYMPGLTVFIPMQRLLTEETEQVLFGSFSVFHHSNGQDGNEFNALGEFNQYNGNFSTNYVEPAIWLRNRLGTNYKTDRLLPIKRPFYELFGKAGIEIHFKTANRLKPSYGSGRLNLSTGLIRIRKFTDIHRATGAPLSKPYNAEQFRILFNTTIITGARTLGLNRFEKRINSEASFHYRIPSSLNAAGMFSVGYYGSDPYNIYYGDSYAYVRVGLSMGIFFVPRRQQP